MATTTTTTCNEVNRKQAFGVLVQEVLLEPSKQNTDLESYLDELVEYLQPQMDKMLHAKGRGILFFWRVQVKYSKPRMRRVDYDDEDNWIRCHDEDDYDEDEDDSRPVYLHSAKLQILNR